MAVAFGKLALLALAIDASPAFRRVDELLAPVAEEEKTLPSSILDANWDGELRIKT